MKNADIDRDTLLNY